MGMDHPVLTLFPCSTLVFEAPVTRPLRSIRRDISLKWAMQDGSRDNLRVTILAV